MKSNTLAKLNRVARELNELAGHFEDLGLERQRAMLDRAGDRVEEVRDLIADL